MKKIIKYFFSCMLFCFPFLVNAKVTCSNGNYNATIDIDKTELTMTDTANITISSDFNYEIEYRMDNEIISKIRNNEKITDSKVMDNK